MTMIEEEREIEEVVAAMDAETEEVEYEEEEDDDDDDAGEEEGDEEDGVQEGAPPSGGASAQSVDEEVLGIKQCLGVLADSTDAVNHEEKAPSSVIEGDIIDANVLASEESDRTVMAEVGVREEEEDEGERSEAIVAKERERSGGGEGEVSRVNSELEVDAPDSPSSSGYAGERGTSSASSACGTREDEICEVRDRDFVNGVVESQEIWTPAKRHVDEMGLLPGRRSYIYVTKEFSNLRSLYIERGRLSGKDVDAPEENISTEGK